MIRLLLAVALFLPGCAAPLALSAISAMGTGVGIYQTWAARQAEHAKIAELPALREEIHLLRKQLPNPPP